MALSSRDFPPELKNWWTLFQKCAYRHDYGTLFSDFVTLFVTQFCLPGQLQEWHTDSLRSYNESERKLMGEMIYELIDVFRIKIDVQGEEFYDLFGHCYETICSSGKKSSLGQFFTPVEVVRLMAELTMDKELTGKTISDPACGSGRGLFIAHVMCPGNTVYGVDIDPLCAKMTALNLMFHGCRGIVECDNTLWPGKDWRFGFKINMLEGYPFSIIPMDQAESHNAGLALRLAEMESKVSEVRAAAGNAKEETVSKSSNSQLKLF